MSATLNNGNARPASSQPQRKSLASQLDRLDGILDGLDEALGGAITEAVREAVASAVAETVRATVLDLVAHPQLAALFRPPVAPAPEPTPAAPATPATSNAVVRVVKQAARWTASTAKAACAATKSMLAAAAATCVRHAEVAWALRRPLGVALGVGVVAGAVSYACSPWLAGVVSGLSATGAALGVQTALFARRLFAGPAPAR